MKDDGKRSGREQMDSFQTYNAFEQEQMIFT